MRPRFMFTKFFTDPNGTIIPVASAYGGRYRAPMHPASPDGFAIIEIWAAEHQLDAAKQDDRVIVLPHLFDPSPLPQAVIDAYNEYGAISGMSMGALLAKLTEIEPIYGHTF